MLRALAKKSIALLKAVESAMDALAAGKFVESIFVLVTTGAIEIALLAKLGIIIGAICVVHLLRRLIHKVLDKFETG